MSLIETIHHGPIRELRLARPPVNALDMALCSSLADALSAAWGEGAEGVVLAGGATIFSAGLDVPSMLAHGADRAAVLQSWTSFFDVARALAESPVPVVAALGGHAPAGGCVLALCCDYRVMARSTNPAKPYLIGLNETQVGLVAPPGIYSLLRRVAGPHRAERLLVAGELLSAERAFEAGLVDELADQAEVTARAVQWLQALLALPRGPMLQTRYIARSDVRHALSPEMIQLDRFVDGWYTADAQQALQAMVARVRKS